MNKVFTLLKFTHKSFDGIKHVVVKLEYEDEQHIPDYFEQAKEKVCKKYNLNKEEVEVLDFSYLSTECIVEEKPDKETINMEELYKKVITNIFGEDVVFDVTEYNKICNIIDETVKILQER